MNVSDLPKTPVSTRALAWVFTRFGNFTFGGGSATIATLHREVIDRRKWMSPESFHLCYVLSRLSPGTNLLAFGTACGWLLRGWAGALVCLLAASIPCSTIAVVVTGLYAYWSSNPSAMLAIEGAMVAAVGVMFITGVTLIRPHWRSSTWPQLVLFVGGSFVVNYFLSVSPLWTLLGAAVLGFAWSAEGKAHEDRAAIPVAAQGNGHNV